MLTPQEEDLSIDIVRYVRDAVGPEVDLMIEAHSRFGVSQAIRIAKRLEEFHPAWLEEPVPHHNPLATIEVARATSVPIATGESLSSKQAAAELLRHGAIQILQIEPVHIGGILASRKIADMADAFYGVLAPHSASGALSCGIMLPRRSEKRWTGDTDFLSGPQRGERVLQRPRFQARQGQVGSELQQRRQDETAREDLGVGQHQPLRSVLQLAEQQQVDVDHPRAWRPRRARDRPHVRRPCRRRAAARVRARSVRARTR